MFDATSRYYRHPLNWLALPRPDGGAPIELRYVCRRIIPRDPDGLVLSVHRTVDGDRLDNVTADHLGDPTQFWRICDASGAASPDDLEKPGALLRIPAF